MFLLDFLMISTEVNILRCRLVWLRCRLSWTLINKNFKRKLAEGICLFVMHSKQLILSVLLLSLWQYYREALGNNCHQEESDPNKKEMWFVSDLLPLFLLILLVYINISILIIIYLYILLNLPLFKAINSNKHSHLFCFSKKKPSSDDSLIICVHVKLGSPWVGWKSFYP